MNLEVWNDRCAHCGKDLPISAPARQRYCDRVCRDLGYAQTRFQRLPRFNEERRVARLAAKCDRPCPECRGTIPASAPRHRKFCSERCLRLDNTRRYAAAASAERTAAKADRLCSECHVGTIPASASLQKKTCSVLCQDRRNARRKAEWQRAQRLAARPTRSSKSKAHTERGAAA